MAESKTLKYNFVEIKHTHFVFCFREAYFFPANKNKNNEFYNFRSWLERIEDLGLPEKDSRLTGAQQQDLLLSRGLQKSKIPDSVTLKPTIKTDKTQRIILTTSAPIRPFQDLKTSTNHPGLEGRQLPGLNHQTDFDRDQETTTDQENRKMEDTVKQQMKVEHEQSQSNKNEQLKITETDLQTLLAKLDRKQFGSPKESWNIRNEAELFRSALQDRQLIGLSHLAEFVRDQDTKAEQKKEEQSQSDKGENVKINETELQLLLTQLTREQFDSPKESWNIRDEAELFRSALAAQKQEKRKQENDVKQNNKEQELEGQGQSDKNENLSINETELQRLLAKLEREQFSSPKESWNIRDEAELFRSALEAQLQEKRKQENDVKQNNKEQELEGQGQSNENENLYETELQLLLSQLSREQFDSPKVSWNIRDEAEIFRSALNAKQQENNGKQKKKKDNKNSKINETELQLLLSQLSREQFDSPNESWNIRDEAELFRSDLNAQQQERRKLENNGNQKKKDKNENSKINETELQLLLAQLTREQFSSPKQSWDIRDEAEQFRSALNAQQLENNGNQKKKDKNENSKINETELQLLLAQLTREQFSSPKQSWNIRNEAEQIRKKQHKISQLEKVTVLSHFLSDN